MPTIYDISVPLRTGGVVYPGNPEIRITPQQEIAKGASSNVSSLSFGTHSGTHVDAPLHMFADGAGVDTLSLATLMGPALLLDFGNEVMAVGEAELRANALAGQLAGAERVLLRTRNSRLLLPRGEFVKDYTYLAPDGAAYLVSLGVKLVGVDYFSVEQFHSGHHRTHLTLLQAGTIIIEGLSLAGPPSPPAGRYELRCLPLRIAGGDGAPARAVLVADDAASAAGR